MLPGSPGRQGPRISICKHINDNFWSRKPLEDRRARTLHEALVMWTSACRHGLGELVTVQHRNIEEHGFPGELHGKADALFLDLPGPWKALPSVMSLQLWLVSC